jgi:hypothetical protein
MKSNELRIGNYILISVLSDNGNFEYEMFKVNSTTIRDAERYGDEWNAEPIALTEEWLLKFGFKKGNSIYPEGYSINILNTDTYLRPSFEGGFYWGFNLRNKSDCELYNAKPIKYVHQLQNLYFALTGNELEIK